MDHRPEIDGLRTIAVMPVILSHAKFGLVSGGYLGVDIFFVISGYLISLILIDDLQEGRFSLARFYERRARRILPALVVVISVTSALAWAWLLPAELKTYSDSLIAVGLFGSNILFWQTENYFAPVADLAPLLHTWSLAVEEQFYLLFPLVLMALWRFARHRLVLVLALLTLASLLLSQYAARHHGAANFYLAPTRVWELLAGALAGWFMLHRPPAASEIGGAAGLALIVASLLIYDETTPIPSFWALAPVGGAALVLVYARGRTWVARFLSLRPMVWIGLISYSAYLWHQPIFALARIKMLERPSTMQMLALVALSLVLAALSWRFVEQPFRGSAGQRRFPASRIFVLSGLSMAGMIGLGLAGTLSDGADGRLTPAANARRAEFAANFDGMQAAMRSGTCAFTERGRFQHLGPFLQNWNCRGTGTVGWVATAVAIYGDSHASDIAAALWLNGHDSLQLTGVGCSLAPSQMSPPCRQIADRFRSEIASVGVTQVWLANRFNPAELGTTVMSETAAFWSLPGVTVILFSPLPEFPAFEPKMIRQAWKGEVPDLTPDLRAHDRFMQADLQQVLAEAGIAVADSKLLFCAARPGCSPISDNAMLMLDESHLAPVGARAFGAGLLSAHPVP